MNTSFHDELPCRARVSGARHLATEDDPDPPPTVLDRVREVLREPLPATEPARTAEVIRRCEWAALELAAEALRLSAEAVRPG